MQDRFRVVPLLLILGSMGCTQSDPPTVAKADVVVPTLGEAFDRARSGTIQGRVTWNGDIPKLPDVQAAIPIGKQNYTWEMKPAPYAPKIDAQSTGLANVLISLNGIDLNHSKPWDLPPVTVLQRNQEIEIHQGDTPPGTIGIVHLGDAVTFDSSDTDVAHMMRARGAATFTLPFPQPHQPLTRHFDTVGHVELTSGAKMVWMVGDLFVADQPYYTVTDAQGRYTLKDVPDGKYELKVWVRNWRVLKYDRDTDTGITIRNRYAKPLMKTIHVTVKKNEITTQHIIVSESDFPTLAE